MFLDLSSTNIMFFVHLFIFVCFHCIRKTSLSSKPLLFIQVGVVANGPLFFTVIHISDCNFIRIITAVACRRLLPCIPLPVILFVLLQLWCVDA